MARMVITLNANGGTLNSTQYLLYDTTEKWWKSNVYPYPTLTYIAPPTREGYTFTGFWYGSTLVLDLSGVLPVPPPVLGDKAVRAGWVKAELDGPPALSGPGGFSAIEDFFGLASSALIPIASQSGDNSRRVCVSNATWSNGSQTGGAGRLSSGVSRTSGVWRNPSVTYRVVADTTIALSLGKAFPAVSDGGMMSVSGYMITSVRVATAVGSFPTVTVSGVANEGADAINLFPVSIPVVARSRAQNLLSAISGGGLLQSMELVAECTPVVLAENGMPCASDVVGGKYVASATTCAPDNAAAPMAANGFVATDRPMLCGDATYLSWQIEAEKEMA